METQKKDLSLEAIFVLMSSQMVVKWSLSSTVHCC